MNRMIISILPWLTIAGCSVDLHIYDHRISRDENSSDANVYAELYFNSTPPLANIRIVSDGTDNNFDKIVGTTPDTIRISRDERGPFNTNICGRTIITLFERKGYITQKTSAKINCFNTGERAEKNPNTIFSVISPSD